MVSKNVVLYAIIAIIITAIGFLSFKEFIKRANYTNIFQQIKAIEVDTKTFLNKNLEFEDYNHCKLSKTNTYFEFKDSETLLASEWLGLASDYTGCSYIINDSGPFAADDYVRVISYTSSDKKVVNIKLIWADKNSDGLSDISEAEGENLKEELETFLKQRLENAL